MTDYKNPVAVHLYVDEFDRMARETARDAYQAALALLKAGLPDWRRFGVQHAGGKITLTVELQP